ncbi:MAG: nucleotide exchange factor GrpE [bacterium]
MDHGNSNDTFSSRESQPEPNIQPNTSPDPEHQKPTDSEELPPEEKTDAEPSTPETDSTAQILKTLVELKSSFDAKFKFDQYKENIINRLHAELQQYKDDLYSRILQPLLHDLIRLHDDLDSMIQFYQTQSAETEPARMFTLLQDFKQQVLDILEKHDVFTFTSLAEQFDPKTQQIVRTIPSPRKAQGGLIHRRLRTGFKRHERIIRPEGVEVVVYQMKSPIKRKRA